MSVNISLLLQEKLNLLIEFSKLSEQQLQALDKQDIDFFNELLDRKQALIEKINLLDDKIRDLQNTPESGTPGSHTGNGTSGEKPASQLESEIKDCLQKTWNIDLQVKQKFESCYKNLMELMGNLKVARRTEEAYRSGARRIQSYFVNKKR